MAHKYQIANSHLSHSRNITPTLIAIGLVMLLAAGSGLAFNMHDNRQRASVAGEASGSSASQQESIDSSSTVQNTSENKVEVMSTNNSSSSTQSGDGSSSSPNESNTSNSSTTVTVNGETVHVGSNGSLKKSYTSSDGLTKVRIFIDNLHSRKEENNSD